MSFNSFAAIVRIVSNPEVKTVGRHELTECRGVHSYSYKENSDIFMDLTFWGSKGAAAEKILKKGSSIFVKGNLRFSQSGEKTYISLNVEDFHCVNTSGKNGAPSKPKSGKSVESVDVEVEEEIPF